MKYLIRSAFLLGDDDDADDVGNVVTFKAGSFLVENARDDVTREDGAPRPNGAFCRILLETAVLLRRENNVIMELIIFLGEILFVCRGSVRCR